MPQDSVNTPVGSDENGNGEEKKDHFINIFEFHDDASKDGRILSSVKIGGVYMSRMVVEPGIVTGNYYHKLTSSVFYVESGSVVCTFQQINTKQRKYLQIAPARQVVHVPPYVAIATENVGFDAAIMVFFSNRPLRSDDNYEYKVV